MSQELRRSSLSAAHIVVLGFLAAVFLGTSLLMLPFASTATGSAAFWPSVFTAVSAICVTGLSTVDPATHWTGFGQVVIMLLIQMGGLGIMTVASILGLVLAQKSSLKTRLNTSAESQALGLSDFRKVLVRVLQLTAIIEFVIAVILSLRLHYGYGEEWGLALWHGLFHSISSFNNAGFALYSDNLMSFQSDPIIQLTIDGAIILGGLGFPVLIETYRRFGLKLIGKRPIQAGMPTHWSLHASIVYSMTGILLVVGTIYFGWLEWNNPATLGPMTFGDKMLNSFTASVMPRTAGFNTIDISQMSPTSWLGTDLLMFIGGASAGTAGGIKITTLAVLIFIVLTEIRGDTAVNVGTRRLPRSIQRQALAIVSMASATVIFAILFLHVITPFSTDQIAFEVFSAFGTVGLTTGITSKLSEPAQVVIMLLMFTGRVGTVLIASALARRVTKKHYELPRERPIIG